MPDLFELFKKNESKLHEPPPDRLWKQLELRLEQSRKQRRKRPEIRFLQRTLIVTDDEDLKELARTKLEGPLGKKREDDLVKEAQARLDRFGRLEKGIWDLRHEDVPFVTRLRYMVLGPPRDPAYCAGPRHAAEAACASSFRDWEERTEAERAR